MTLNRALKPLSLTLLLIASSVVALGAYTRLADAGLGCPDWPTCYGHLWVPNSTHEIEKANTLFSDTPVEKDKTWPEQIHRIFASSLGLLILITFAIFNAQRAKSNNVRKINSVTSLLTLLVSGMVFLISIISLDKHHLVSTIELTLSAIIALYFANLIRIYQRDKLRRERQDGFVLSGALAGLVILQGLFGMWTVTLKLWPQVVTTHLLGGFATLSLIALLFKQCWLNSNQYIKASKSLLVASYTVLVLIIFQIALGGWMSSNYAALACPDFPLCQNALVPPMDFQSGFNFLQHVGPNYLYGKLDSDARTAIHYTHRVGALLVTFSTLVLTVLLIQTKGSLSKKYAATLLTILVTQLGLGISNIVLALPIQIAVLHNAFGATLLICALFILSSIRKEET